MNEVDEHLLQWIESGDQEGWRQFVERFQRRLIAFASKRVQPAATAEDLVQETFISFLSARQNFRGAGELESFLFQILRHRLIDHYRRNGVVRELPVCDFRGRVGGDAIASEPSTDHSASWYVRQSEHNAQAIAGLSGAVAQLASYLQENEKFKELKIAEGLFFARRRNQELAAAIGINENEVAVTKRRLIGRLRDALNHQADPASKDWHETDLTTDILSQVWEFNRPSCPKRSTLGKYTLGILPATWAEYIAFHLQTLGCSFCNANLEELNTDPPAGEDAETRDRLFQSTIGFFRP